MKILNELPPIYHDVVKAFGPVPDTVVFAYGDTIYNPGNHYLTLDVLAHEEVHERQQAGDPADWWVKFLADPEFRLDQELEAYRAQYKAICGHFKSHDIRFVCLTIFAKSLSGPIYGNMLSHREAMTLIKT